MISLTRARSFKSFGYSGRSYLSARYFRIAELSVSLKPSSSSIGTSLFGLSEA
jgi:hypothetical protein